MDRGAARVPAATRARIVRIAARLTGIPAGTGPSGFDEPLEGFDDLRVPLGDHPPHERLHWPHQARWLQVNFASKLGAGPRWQECKADGGLQGPQTWASGRSNIVLVFPVIIVPALHRFGGRASPTPGDPRLRWIQSRDRQSGATNTIVRRGRQPPRVRASTNSRQRRVPVPSRGLVPPGPVLAGPRQPLSGTQASDRTRRIPARWDVPSSSCASPSAPGRTADRPLSPVP
jgi:hypothetical protein